MNGRTFVDSNILVYAHDVDAGRKHEAANRVIRDLWGDGSGTVSIQVLQEFYINVTRKIAPPLDRHSARTVARRYAKWCIEPRLADIESAFQIEDESHIQFWDALIVASAARAGATRLLTEDLNAGQTIRGVRIENPL